MAELDGYGIAQLGAAAGLALVSIKMLRDVASVIGAIRETLAGVAASLAILPKLHEVLTNVQVTQAQLLERERMRWERKFARDRAAQQGQQGENWDEETQPFEIPPTPPKRARTNPYGVQIPSGGYGPTKEGGGG